MEFLYFGVSYSICIIHKYTGMHTDGGTKIWKAKIYTLVHWNKLTQYDEDGNILYMPEPNGWKIYWWPNQDEWMYL